MNNIEDFKKELEKQGVKPNTFEADKLYLEWQKREIKEDAATPTVKDMFDKHYELIALFDDDMQQTIIKKINENFKQ